MIRRLIDLRSTNISVGGVPGSIGADVENLARNFLAANPALVGIPFDQVGKVHTMTDGRRWSMSFGQEYGGVPVLDSEIGLTIDESGHLVAFGVRAYPDLKLDVVPTINVQSALSLIRRATQPADLETVTPPTLLITPEEVERSFRFRLVWSCLVRDANEAVSAEKGFMVDAHSGQIFGPFETGRTFADGLANPRQLEGYDLRESS